MKRLLLIAAVALMLAASPAGCQDCGDCPGGKCQAQELVGQRIQLPTPAGQYWATFIDADRGDRAGMERANHLANMLTGTPALWDMVSQRTKWNYYRSDNAYVRTVITPACGPGPLFMLQEPDRDANGKATVIYKVSGKDIPRNGTQMARDIQRCIQYYAATGRGPYQNIYAGTLRSDCDCRPKPPQPPTPPPVTPPSIPPILNTPLVGPSNEEMDTWMIVAILAGLTMTGIGIYIMFNQNE